MTLGLDLVVAIGPPLVVVALSMLVRARSAPRGLVAYDLAVRGERRVLGDAGTAMASTLAGHKRDRCAIWRFYDGGRSRVVLYVWSTKSHRAVAEQVARAVGATATEIEHVDLPAPPVVVSVIRRQIHPHRHDTEIGENQIPSWLAHAMGDVDSDPAAVVGVALAWLGHPTPRVGRWMDHVAGIDRSATGGAALPRWQQYALVSMVVGGSSVSEASALARGILPLLPGVHIDAAPVAPHDRVAGVAGVVLGVVLAGAALGTHLAALWPVAAACVLSGAWWAFSAPAASRLRRTISTGALRVAKPRWLLPTRISPSALILTPTQAAALVEPPHRGDLGAEGTLAVEQAPPPSVQHAVGSALGRSADGSAVCVDDGDRWRGVFVSGDAGSGKSTVLLGLWGQDVASSQGHTRTHIWIETKGEGADRAHIVAPDATWIRVGETTGPRLDLMSATDTEEHAVVFVDALRYAFGERAISWSSRDLLIGAISLALCDETYEALGVPAEHRNPLRTARLFLGGVNAAALNQAMAMLGRAVQQQGAQRDGVLASVLVDTGSHFERAVAAWSHQLARRATEIRALMTPPANKLRQLEAIRGLWSPGGRDALTLDEILTSHRDVIIDLGSASTDRDTVTQTAALITYLLWQAICRRCGDWRETGQAVRIYSDELSDIAGAGADDQDILGAMVDQGRSRGVELAIGTQRLDQIPERTRHAALALGAKLYLSAENPGVADLASADLGGIFTASDLRHLPPYTGAVRMRVRGQATPAFSLHVAKEGVWSERRT